MGDGDSVIVHDYQKMIGQKVPSIVPKLDPRVQVEPVIRNAALQKIKKELMLSSLQKSNSGESSKSLLSENFPTNRSSRGNLFEQLDDKVKEKLKLLIPSQFAHRQSISFARAKPHMFEKEEITE